MQRGGLVDIFVMANSREFGIDRSWITLYFWLGLVVLGMAGVCLAGPFIDPKCPWWLAGASGAFAFAGGWWCLRIALRPAVYSVELSDDGVRIPAEGKWAPWSSLSGLSERPIAQRIDILDLKGSRFASLEYQLESFSEAAERTVAALKWSPPKRDTFRRSISTWFTIAPILAGSAMTGLGAWLWLHDGERSGGLLVTLLLAAAAYDAATEIWSVTVLPRDLYVRYGVRRLRIPWKQIAAVRLALRPIGNHNRLLDVVISLVAGPALRVRPPGTNPFDLYSRLSEHLRSV